MESFASRTNACCGCAEAGLTDQALVEFGECLGPVPSRERQQAIDYATVRYIDRQTDVAEAV